MKMPKGQSFEPGMKKRPSSVIEWRFTEEDLARLMAQAADRPGRSWVYANTPEARRKSKATKARNAKARQAAATAAWREARAVEQRIRIGNGATARVLAAIAASGEWLGVRDIVRLSGVAPSSVKAIVYQKLATRGLIERTENPAYSGKGTPWTRWSAGAGNVEPQYLWRITEAGREMAEANKKGLAPGELGRVGARES